MAFVSSSFVSSSFHSALPTRRPICPISTTPSPRHATNISFSPIASLSSYDQLRTLTTIVEDTGDLDMISTHKPHSATTNPSLVAAAAVDPRFASLVSEAVTYGRSQHCATRHEQLTATRDKLSVLFGAQIVGYLGSEDGDVSTEVDARLSFDIDAQVQVGRKIIDMYEKECGIGRERVLIKLASTWEGLQACEILEKKYGIRTNMTLLFSKAQAIAAAQAGAFLISPFVGRILDWYKASGNFVEGNGQEDPGVKSVREIYHVYKCMGWDTIVMGASFRNLDEIVQLAGCDRLTIAPKFVQQLQDMTTPIERKLVMPGEGVCEGVLEGLGIEKGRKLSEKEFRWMMNEDAMATEKLAHGIRGFAKDLGKLDRQLEALIDA